jgi:hypothetical protein
MVISWVSKFEGLLSVRRNLDHGKGGSHTITLILPREFLFWWPRFSLDGFERLGIPVLASQPFRTDSGADTAGFARPSFDMRLLPVVSAALVALPAAHGAYVGSSSPLPRFGTARSAVAASPAAADVRMMVDAATGVPLTGQTLDAALKIRCDLTGASYAIYWGRVRDELKVLGTYSANDAVAGYVAGSKNTVLDALGDGPVATVKRTQVPYFVPEISTSTLKRRELAIQNTVSQVALVPFEDGVLEFGNSKSAAQWPSIPTSVPMPKRELRRAFEDLGASYAMWWALEDNDELKVRATYENPREMSKLIQLRNDGETFTKISARLTLNAKGDGPVGKALQTMEEQVAVFGEEDSTSTCASMKRAEVAKEFDVGEIHFYPVEDQYAAPPLSPNPKTWARSTSTRWRTSTPHHL